MEYLEARIGGELAAEAMVARGRKGRRAVRFSAAR
jgi:hypothetical protein